MIKSYWIGLIIIKRNWKVFFNNILCNFSILVLSWSESFVLQLVSPFIPIYITHLHYCTPDIGTARFHLIFLFPDALICYLSQHQILWIAVDPNVSWSCKLMRWSKAAKSIPWIILARKHTRTCSLGLKVLADLKSLFLSGWGWGGDGFHAKGDQKLTSGCQ